MKWARKRDGNEKAIIAALRDIGASVSQLDGIGLPDLLVGFRGQTTLMEVKMAHGVPKVGGKKSEDGLLPSQRLWHEQWKGGKPWVVATPEEALVVVGHVKSGVRI